MKYFYDSTALNFKWDQIANAFWFRYPNPFSKHVMTEDVISRDVVDDKLFTKRLIKKTNSVTKLARKFVKGATYTFVIEESIVDPVRKMITTYTRNIGLTKLVQVEEKCVYKVNPENVQNVICEREAWISTQHTGASAWVICSFVHHRFKGNAKKAFNGFNHVLEAFYGSQTGHLKHAKGVLTDTAQKATDVAKKMKNYVPKP